MHWLFRRASIGPARSIADEPAKRRLHHRSQSRSLFPIVDDKLYTYELCRRINVPTPEVFGVVAFPAQLRLLKKALARLNEFVIKPNRGSSGRGVLVIIARDRDRFLRHNGQRLHFDDLHRYIADILSGMYSLGGRPDQALIQHRVKLHPHFAPISYKGVPDVRVIVYRGAPAMAMLRLPTSRSNGRANLHQGGVGVGLDLKTGITHHAVLETKSIESHPDTNVNLLGLQVPCWSEVLNISRLAASAVGLGYLGVDLVIDAERGPMLLEANARPGLAIQIANNRGLIPALAEIDAEFISASSADRRACRFAEC